MSEALSSDLRSQIFLVKQNITMAHALQHKQTVGGAAMRCSVQSHSRIGTVAVSRVQRTQQHICFAGKLDEVSLFADSSIVGGKSSSSVSTQAKSQPVKLEDIPLNSEVNALNI